MASPIQVNLEQLLQEDGGRKIRTSIEPNGASFQEVLDLVVAINDLYDTFGISQRLTLDESRITQVPESEYDIHAGTEFSNTKKIYTKSLFPLYVDRKEVYQALEINAPPNLVKTIREDIDKRWPTERFEDTFPYTATMSHLVNEYELRSER